MTFPYDAVGEDIPLGFMWGTYELRPLAPNVGQAGQFYYATAASVANKDTLWVTDVEAGIVTWKLVGGGGGGPAAAMKYFVNNSPTVSPQPTCLYTTIGAAQAAAVADGHNAASPAVIWLCPSAVPFTESVKMVAGISIKGMVDDLHFNVAGPTPATTLPVILGDVEIIGTASLSYVRVQGHVLCTGAVAMFPVLDHVEIVAPDTSLSVTNPLAQVSMYQCSVSTPGSPAVFCNSAQIDAIECDFRAKDDQLAVFFTAGTYSFRDCRFVGVITLAAVTAAVFDGCNISSSGSAAFLLADGSPLTVRRSTIDNPFSMTVAGSGSYSFVDNDFPSGLQSIDTNVGSSPIYVNRSHTEFEFKGIAPLYVITQLFDLYTRDTLGADNTIQLPALNTVPLGTRLTIKKTGVKTTGSITLTTSAGNTIDSGLSFLLQSGALTSVEVEAGVTDWRVLNRSVAIQTGSGLFKNGVTPAPILATIGTKSVILVTRRLPNTGLPGIGIPTVTTPPVGSAGTAFTVEAQDPATNIPVATDQSNFDWAVIG